EARHLERNPDMSPVPSTFGALILAQAAHSTEEVAGRLWESFRPARFVGPASHLHGEPDDESPG
ncbi:MAG: hypothetical protein KJZ47_14720, partial [Gemmatimonadales bacterium]|nr:hypothetical protein [Gemmatimonadales bacterium]